MSARFVLVVLLVTLPSCVAVEPDPSPAAIDWAAFATPPAGHGPWVRWWWPGGDVEDGELAREIGVLAAAGISGAEIQAFAAALDPEAPEDELARRSSWGTDDFHDHVRAALDAAADAGLGISLTVGSGWPMGGDHLSAAGSLKTLLISEHYRTGPGTTTIPMEGPDLAPFYQIAESAEAMGEPLARYLGDQAELVTVLAAEMVDGERDPNPLVLTDQVWLDRASLKVLTDEVGGDTLVWEVPPGEWVVIAFWAAPDGEYVSLDAYPGEAWVVDHLDAAEVEATLDVLLGPIVGHAALEGFFTDSFELKAERLWADDLLDEIVERRGGYDPELALPVVMMPGADNHIFDGAGIPRMPPFGFDFDDGRVLDDWQRTLSELFIERYVETCTSWAEARGLRSRIQPYGVGIDVISAAGAAHVPEAEQLYAGGSDLFVKAVASGAQLGGREIVSAESMVWAGKDHMLTPTKLKASADKLFTAGVNRILFHGFPYRVEVGYGDQGWHPFSSPWSGSGTYGSAVGETNPYWAFMPAISRYLARVQWALRQGRPDTDVAVYFPFIGVSAALGRQDDWDEELYQGDFPGEPGGARDALFDLVDTVLGPADPGPAVDWMIAAKPYLDDLEEAGLTWQWVNDDFLAGATVGEGGRIHIGETDYGAVSLLNVPWMEVESAEALAAAVQGGAQLVVEGPAPARVPGVDLEDLDTRVAKAGLSGGGTLPEATFAAGAGIRMIRRRLEGGGGLVFYRNPSAAVETLRVPIEGCATPALLDPWKGTFRHVEAETRDELLPPWGSRILTCGLGTPDPEDGWFDLSGQGFQEDAEITTWELVVVGPDVAEGEVVLDAADLPDWRDVEALRFSSTPGIYTGMVNLPDAPAGYAVLRLGAVNGAATVLVNGADAGAALVPPFDVDVTGMLVAGDNTVEVTLIPPLRNRLVGHGTGGDEEYVQYDDEETLVPVGLRGPVEVLYF